jgi:hypothetical protein
MKQNILQELLYRWTEGGLPDNFESSI